jgi:hypothetical protein
MDFKVRNKCSFIVNFIFSKKYFVDFRGLKNIIRCLKDTGVKGSSYIFSGVFDLISSEKETDWRFTVQDYVEEVASFAKAIWYHKKAPVIIQLPWLCTRNNNSLLRVQRDEVNIYFQ